MPATAAHAPLDNPYATAQLLDALRAAGATDQIEALLARDPAAHASLGHPAATARLLDALRAAGATDQVEALLARDPAAHAALGNPDATTRLLEALRAAGATDQVEALLARDPPPTPPSTTQPPPPDCWTRCGQRAPPTQIEILLARAAAHTPLGHPAGIIQLLDAFRVAGATDQVEILIARAQPPTPSSATRMPCVAVARLLNARQGSGPDQCRGSRARAGSPVPHTP